MSNRLSPRDQRIALALVVLRDQLGPVVDEITFRELDQDDRHELARVLRTIADDLDPVVESQGPALGMAGARELLGQRTGTGIEA